MKKGEKPEYDNIAPEAKADGICDYTNDLGGLATLNDGYEPTESHDTSHGAWHNWNNRYENGVAKNAWVSYTWDKPVEINSMDIYYFSDHGGIVAPKSASFEYLNDAGEWVVADEAQGLACVEDEYNTVKLANIKTKAIRMTMEPEFMNDGDPAHGVGVIEWKVYGKYAEDKPETVDKTALDAVIREAESRAEKDYTSDSWETFARVLESAKAVQKNESATQEEVDNATALLTEAMDNLEPVKEEPVKEADKKELKKAIANAEKYTRVDYTEESWNDFQTALQAAYLVDNNTAATQKEVDDALQALQTAIKNLKKVQEEVKKDDIRKYIEKAQKLNKEDYTKEEIEELIEKLIIQQIITEEQARVIDRDKIWKFTQSSLAKEVRESISYEKEMPFYLTLSAKEAYGEEIDEDILVQGIIDLYYINAKGELVLVDYKTDFVKQETELVEKYQYQLQLYQKALEKALEKKVARIYIYSTCLEKAIPIDIM